MAAMHDSFRPSTAGWLRGTAAGLGTLGLGLAGFAAMIAMAGEWGAWPLLLTALSALIILWQWVRNMAALFVITPERLIVHRGIVFKSIDEVELYRIKDVRMDFSLLNQWAGIGTICLTSSDETTRAGNLVMRHVEKARARREDLRGLIDAARQKRGVREIDMVHDDY